MNESIQTMTTHRYRSSLTIAPTSSIEDRTEAPTSSSIATTPGNSSPFTTQSPSSSSTISFDCDIGPSSKSKSIANQTINDHSTPQHQHRNSTLFVGSLSPAVGDGQLKQLFEPFGPIISIDIKRDKRTNASLGYAFIVLNDRDAAVRAKNALTGRVLNGRAIRIGYAHPNTTLFVGNIAYSLTKEELCQAFRPFGELVESSCFIRNGKPSAPHFTSARYALLNFVKREDAEQAKKAMDGQVLAGRPVRVAWGDSSISKTSVQVFVPQFCTVMPSYETLLQEFSRFGRVINIAMNRSIPGQNAYNGTIYLLATVQYDESESGERSTAAAISALNGQTIGDVQLSVSYCRRVPHNRTISPRETVPQPFNMYRPINCSSMSTSSPLLSLHNPYGLPMYSPQDFSTFTPLHSFPSFTPMYAPVTPHQYPVGYSNPGYMMPASQAMYTAINSSLNHSFEPAQPSSSESSQPLQPPER